MARKGNKLLLVMILFLIFHESHLSGLNLKKLHKIWNSTEVPYKNENFYQFWNRIVLPKIKANPGRHLRNNELSYDVEPTGSDFPCRALNGTTKPTSVHRLRPSDVNVVAALGDSITAAFGAKSSDLLTLFIEYRGVSWTIGGEKALDKVTTLPNILKKYNPKLKGFSVRETIPLIPLPKNARFNVAVTGKSLWVFGENYRLWFQGHMK